MNVFLVVSPSAIRFQARCYNLLEMERVVVGASDMSLQVPLQQKRHNLARSQVNSSEYFSVGFEIEGRDAGHEFLLASKGISLAEALGGVCARRGVELSGVEVLLEQYKTPLPVLTTDTAWLGGKHITVRVSEKDNVEAKNNRTTSQSCRKTSRSCKGKSNFFSSSTEDCGSNLESLALEGKIKGPKQRWSGFFGNSKTAWW